MLKEETEGRTGSEERRGEQKKRNKMRERRIKIAIKKKRRKLGWRQGGKIK